MLTADARAVQRERAPGAQRRLSVTLGVARDGTARRCGSGAKATGREWRKESAPAGARQGHRCRDRRACDRERSWRMVVLGRRIARGGRERGAKASPPATRGRSRSRSGTPERWPVPRVLAVNFQEVVPAGVVLERWVGNNSALTVFRTVTPQSRRCLVAHSRSTPTKFWATCEPPPFRQTAIRCTSKSSPVSLIRR